MLNVSGLVAIASEPPPKRVQAGKGYYYKFTVVSQDDKKVFHRYQADLFVPENEVDKWEEKLQPGNIFIVRNAHWTMHEYEEGKFPIPSLVLNRYEFKKLSKPYWVEEETEK